MPGTSLWLIPPQSHQLYKTLSELINATIPQEFPSTKPPHFVPHVTLTSGLPSSIPQPQEWLDRLDLPSSGIVRACFEALDVGDVFFKKLTIRVKKGEGLLALTRVGRKEVERGNENADDKVEDWLENAYGPHLSLLYGSMSISDEKKAELEKLVCDAGVNLDGEGEMGGFVGGSVWLVPTDKPLEEWSPIAMRDLR